MSIQEEIQKVLLAEFAAGFDNKSLDPDEDLLEQGVIDSLRLMKLVDFIESKFSIKIVDEEIVPENFMSINSMVKLIEHHMQNA